MANGLIERLRRMLPEGALSDEAIQYQKEYWPGVAKGWKQSVTAIPDALHAYRAGKVVNEDYTNSPFYQESVDLDEWRESEQEFLERYRQQELERQARDTAAYSGDVGAMGEQAGDVLSYALDPVGDTLGGPVGPAIAKVAGKFLPETLGAVIRAYHGTPHTVDKFKMANIGTGEGAQAYGHGLYFAENPEVAKLYSRVVPERGGWDTNTIPGVGETEVFKSLPDEIKAQIEVAFFNGGPDAAKGEIYSLINTGSFTSSNALVRDNLIDIQRGFDRDIKLTGKTYSVDLDVNPEDLLDWDAPLSEQQMEDIADAFSGMMGNGSEYEELADMFRYAHEPMSGEEAYRWITNVFEKGYLSDGVLVTPSGKSARFASEVLSDSGIKGIRYLDQGSRAGAEGTRNIVMFDEDLINIVGKE